MHEFSLAYNIVEIVKESAENAGADKVASITLEVGSLAGVETVALLTALESLTIKTSLEKTEIQIDHIKAEAKCLNCTTSFEPKDLFELCPKCKGYNFNITKGKEFRVKSIEAITK